MTIDEIMQKAAAEPFSRADVDATCAQHGLTVDDLFDAMSQRVVRGYTSGELSFEFCDGVMNHIYSFMLLTHDVAPPDYSHSVFLAFDEGEYHHDGDPADSSPEELYTKPMISEIVATHGNVI